MNYELLISRFNNHIKTKFKYKYKYTFGFTFLKIIILSIDSLLGLFNNLVFFY